MTGAAGSETAEVVCVASWNADLISLLRVAMQWANAAAALSVTRHGAITGIPAKAEVAALLGASSGQAAKKLIKYGFCAGGTSASSYVFNSVAQNRPAN